MAFHREHTRLVVQPLGHVLADALHLAAAAAGAGAGRVLQLVVHVAARQVRRQRLALGRLLGLLVLRALRVGFGLLGLSGRLRDVGELSISAAFLRPANPTPQSGPGRMPKRRILQLFSARASTRISRCPRRSCAFRMDLPQSLRIQAHANRLANRRLHAALAPSIHAEFHAPRAGFFPSFAATLNHDLAVDLHYVGALHGDADLRAGRDAFVSANNIVALAERQRISDERLIEFATGSTLPAGVRTLRCEGVKCKVVLSKGAKRSAPPRWPAIGR